MERCTCRFGPRRGIPRRPRAVAKKLDGRRPVNGVQRLEHWPQRLDLHLRALPQQPLCHRQRVLHGAPQQRQLQQQGSSLAAGARAVLAEQSVAHARHRSGGLEDCPACTATHRGPRLRHGEGLQAGELPRQDLCSKRCIGAAQRGLQEHRKNAASKDRRC